MDIQQNKINGKMETLLNLALAVDQSAREKSILLGEGYDPATNMWELIIKYNGDIGRLREANIQLEELIAGYAIIRIPEPLIEAFSDLDEVEYIEKPKRLFFSILEGRRASCAYSIAIREPYLRGRGILIAVIDSGIDYEGMEFRNLEGKSRILYLWDQTLTAEGVNSLTPEGSAYAGTAQPPEGFEVGVEFSKERIDAALTMPTAAETYQLVPSRDTSGHGTSVTAIAAASGVLEGGQYVGMAPESSLIIVKLGNPLPNSFPRTTEMMRAVTYVVKKAVSLGMPVAINLSFGNTYGSHDGVSLLPRFMDNITEIGRNVVCVGSGNEGAAGGHVAGSFGAISEAEQPVTKKVELNIAMYQQSINVQLWKDFTDRFSISLTSPSGVHQVIDTLRPGKQSLVIEGTNILIFVGEPSPYSVNQEIYFDFIPQATYVPPGAWSFDITAVKTVTGNYNMYLPSSAILNSGTGFFTPTPETTLTIPSTAAKVITVGAYDPVYESYADFSGRGYVLQGSSNASIYNVGIKPDIVAPGVNIRTIAPGGNFDVASGTSFATPFATGGAALLMEWGIIRGNDPYLYGEKVKAYFRRGASELRGESIYPNSRVGFGALCVENSIPR